MSLIGVTEAAHGVIVHQADRLHESVADRGADELEAAILQLFAHRVRFWCARGNLLGKLPAVDARLTVDELPDVAIEAALLLLYREERFGILHGCRDLQPIADDPRIGEKLAQLFGVVAGDGLRV